jgi:nitrogen fixation/metabolism regulation signal transduction histidine kinase
LVSVLRNLYSTWTRPLLHHVHANEVRYRLVIGFAIVVVVVNIIIIVVVAITVNVEIKMFGEV